VWDPHKSQNFAKNKRKNGREKGKINWKKSRRKEAEKNDGAPNLEPSRSVVRRVFWVTEIGIKDEVEETEKKGGRKVGPKAQLTLAQT